MSFEWYIQPLEYEIAEQNGISRQRLEDRIRGSAWDKQKAITIPPKPQKSLKEWRKLAEENGIKYPTLQKRMNILGWEPERAATEPLQDRKKAMAKVAKGRRIYPIEHIETANRNGIRYVTYTQRRYAGWGELEAMTIPVMTRREANRMKRDRYGRPTGEFREQKGVKA